MCYRWNRVHALHVQLHLLIFLKVPSHWDSRMFYTVVRQKIAAAPLIKRGPWRSRDSFLWRGFYDDNRELRRNNRNNHRGNNEGMGGGKEQRRWSMRKREDIRDGGGGDEGKTRKGRREEGPRERQKEEEGKKGRRRSERRPKACVLTAPVDAFACRRACEHYSRVGAHSLRRIII